MAYARSLWCLAADMKIIFSQVNADQSILAGNIGPNTLRQSILGYNQGTNQGRSLLQDITTKMNADQSILAGNIGTNTLRQSILGYNQGTNQGRRLLQDLITEVGSQTCPACQAQALLQGVACCQLLHYCTSVTHASLCDNSRPAENLCLLQAKAHHSIPGYSQGKNRLRSLLQDITTKACFSAFKQP